MIAITRLLTAGLLVASCGRQMLEVAPQQNDTSRSTAPKPPVVRLITNGPNILYRGFTAYFLAEAYDRDGAVRKVEFRAGETVFGSDDTAPYEALLQPATIGPLGVTVTAIDDDGLRGVPHTVHFDVVECPPTEVCEPELPVNDSCCLPPDDRTIRSPHEQS